MARCNKTAYSELWSLFMALYLIPTTRGYGGDMDVLFMIMYGGDLCRFTTKANFLFVPLNGQLFFFLLDWCRTDQMMEKKDLCFWRLVDPFTVYSCLSEPSSYGLPWQNFWLPITVLFFPPRGCQRSCLDLVVKIELSPNPHHEHTGQKIKRAPKRNKSSLKTSENNWQCTLF